MAHQHDLDRAAGIERAEWKRGELRAATAIMSGGENERAAVARVLAELADEVLALDYPTYGTRGLLAQYEVRDVVLDLIDAKVKETP